SPSACARIRLVRDKRPPHPLAQRFVTIAKRPSYRAGMGRASKGDLPDITSEIVCDTLARRANQLVLQK
ncbi:MAG: hypothetical protein WAO01_23245, partial [Bradyrhizobium sp.]